MKKDYITEFFYSLAYNKKNEAEELFFKYTEVQNYPLALHFACYFGRVEFVDIISSHKPINGLDKCGANALHYAVNESSLGENNKDSIYKKFGSGICIPIYDFDLKNKFKSNESICDIIDILIKKEINTEQLIATDSEFPITPIYYPICSNNRPVVEHMLKRGVKVNHVTDDYSILNCLIEHYSPKKYVSEGEDDCLDFAKYLIKNGAVFDSEHERSLDIIIGSIKRQDLKLLDYFLKKVDLSSSEYLDTLSGDDDSYFMEYYRTADDEWDEVFLNELIKTYTKNGADENIVQKLLDIIKYNYLAHEEDKIIIWDKNGLNIELIKNKHTIL